MTPTPTGDLKLNSSDGHWNSTAQPSIPTLMKHMKSGLMTQTREVKWKEESSPAHTVTITRRETGSRRPRGRRHPRLHLPLPAGARPDWCRQSRTCEAVSPPPSTAPGMCPTVGRSRTEKWPTSSVNVPPTCVWGWQTSITNSISSAQCPVSSFVRNCPTSPVQSCHSIANLFHFIIITKRDDEGKKAGSSIWLNFSKSLNNEIVSRG